MRPAHRAAAFAAIFVIVASVGCGGAPGRSQEEVTQGSAQSRTYSVPEVPPDSIPGWVYADSNLVGAVERDGFAFARNTLKVGFLPGATAAQRDAAVAAVSGAVVGGVPVPEAPVADMYYLRVSGNSEDELITLMKRLEAMPGVSFANLAALVPTVPDSQLRSSSGR